ncbi:MAG: hypothetical protein HYX26_09785 [Acidobacteriales bacterium]|nr:hypothetical protein [Terriglobales bacterium]
MLAIRLVQLIEAHSAPLSEQLLKKFLSTPQCSDLNKVPISELKHRSHEIYGNLSDFLTKATAKDVEERYIHLGVARHHQGVSLAHLVYALSLTKEHLLNYLEEQQFYADNSLALIGHLEFSRMLNQFFDRAVYWAVVGYERAEMQERHRHVA